MAAVLAASCDGGCGGAVVAAAAGRWRRLRRAVVAAAAGRWWRRRGGGGVDSGYTITHKDNVGISIVSKRHSQPSVNSEPSPESGTVWLSLGAVLVGSSDGNSTGREQWRCSSSAGDCRRAPRSPPPLPCAAGRDGDGVTAAWSDHPQESGPGDPADRHARRTARPGHQ